MSNQHPITPPPELVQQWIKECDNPEKPRWQEYEQDIATLAAQWGADQELEACCEWSSWRHSRHIADQLRTARRPKPPSLKEQALDLVEQHENGWRPSPKDWDTIRKALEAL